MSYAQNTGVAVSSTTSGQRTRPRRDERRKQRENKRSPHSQKYCFAKLAIASARTAPSIHFMSEISALTGASSRPRSALVTRFDCASDNTRTTVSACFSSKPASRNLRVASSVSKVMVLMPGSLQPQRQKRQHGPHLDHPRHGTVGAGADGRVLVAVLPVSVAETPDCRTSPYGRREWQCDLWWRTRAKS